MLRFGQMQLSKEKVMPFSPIIIFLALLFLTLPFSICIGFGTGSVMFGLAALSFGLMVALASLAIIDELIETRNAIYSRGL
jgi:hypothetical protein